MQLLHWIALGLISVATYVYWYFKVSFSYWKSRNVPHIDPSFPHGNVKGFGSTIHHAEGIQNIYNKLKGSDKLCGVYYYTSPRVLVLDLDLAKNVLVKDAENFRYLRKKLSKSFLFSHKIFPFYFSDRIHDFYSDVKDDPLTNNLFYLNGLPWKNMRNKLSKCFSSGKMRFMFPTIVEVGERFRRHLLEIIKECDELAMGDLLNRFMIDMAGVAAFDFKCNSFTDPNDEFSRFCRVAAFHTNKESPILSQLFFNRFKGLAKMLRMTVFPSDISAYFTKIVKDTVEYRENNDIERNDFLDIFIKLKNKKQNENADDLTLNAAVSVVGFETSARLLLLALLELTSNPDIQAKTRDEIKNVLNAHNGEFTYDAMIEMKYVDQVLQGRCFDKKN